MTEPSIVPIGTALQWMTFLLLYLN